MILPWQRQRRTPVFTVVGVVGRWFRDLAEWRAVLKAGQILQIHTTSLQLQWSLAALEANTEIGELWTVERTRKAHEFQLQRGLGSKRSP